MSKPANLSDAAYAALKAHQADSGESLSAVILKFVPRPIRTFGDLEKHLRDLNGPLQIDSAALERVQARKKAGKKC